MSEIRALLLTDVVDSTHLSTLLGDRDMAQLWAAHDRVARDLLPLHGGREIDKTDGMLLLFDHPGQALAYARAYHEALACLHIPLKARAGLHVGPVILRENLQDDVARGAKPLEVEGLAKPTAARVMALARGGQTLLSAEALQALGEIAGGRRVQSHGHWLMKGVAEPLELFEIGDADGAPFTAPPDGDKSYRVARVGERWLPIRQIPNNLPEQLTSFVGRERELDEIKARLHQTRLLTLLGMGGLGKTRLSLQAADELRAEFPDGVWFLDLAPLRDGALVLAEAAQVMGVREEPGRPLLQTLTAHLKTRRTLIVMDNCEHLLRPCAQLAYAILKAAPQVRLLASSREALRVPGELSYPILPLPVPGKQDSYETLARSTAVRLFVERVQQHRIDYALTPAEAPAVGELVARLEGIPLALELAAARVRMFSVAEINQRLDDRYRELVDGDIVLEERQQTLRALVDWSYDMLTATEQTLFRRLGIFVGGFNLRAAEQVCGTAPVDAAEVKGLLASLAEKSLLVMEERDDGARYRALETLRDYAREKLAQQGEMAATAAAHCHHFFAFAKEVKYALVGPDQGLWANRAETDHDNLRAAMSLAVQGGVDPVIAVKLVVAMQGFWVLRGYASEGLTVVRATLTLPSTQASDLLMGHALYVGAVLTLFLGNNAEATQFLETSLELRRRLGHPIEIAATLSMLAQAHLQRGDADGAIEHESEALQLFERAGERHGQAIGHQHLAHFALFKGDDEMAARHIDLGLQITREIGYREIEAECLVHRAELAIERQQPTLAWQCISESLAICCSAGDRQGEARARRWRARLLLTQASEFEGFDQREAWADLVCALKAFQDFGLREERLAGYEDAARRAQQIGDAETAAVLHAAVDRSREQLQLCRAPREQHRWQHDQTLLMGVLGESSWRACCERGEQSTNGEVMDLAIGILQENPITA